MGVDDKLDSLIGNHVHFCIRQCEHGAHNTEVHTKYCGEAEGRRHCITLRGRGISGWYF